ncbi:MAG: asparagine synthase (glutamine-hydrolyzing) [Candidatus Omnitrophica bacterium]|nr:asparagine synthase (glutamine-hydrolyzing) [Candidatus Omnitrophota bacterium]
MCGIVGFVNLNREKVNKEILWEMTDSLSHRGPDGRGVYTDRYLGLGHRRLSIIDLSEKAHQPMLADGGRYAISYNGEIYNFRELRRVLERGGTKFNSLSDTEVLLRSFAQWGTDSLEKYNGMFAFAFWDKENTTLTLARDRYGIKPLYYWENKKVFMFASEIKAFLKHPDFKVGMDLEALLEYFTFQNTFTSKTLFSGVNIIPPGHYIQVRLQEKPWMRSGKYWDFCFKESKDKKSLKEYMEEGDRLFNQAVKRQLVSDVEIGSFLSGGIDSGSITAIASRHLSELKTFCIGFDLSSAVGLERAFDERKKAEHISYLYQTEHYEMVLKSGDMKKCLPDVVWGLEDLRLGQNYPNYYASKLASSFVKVCLSGAGGDELFGGYPWRYYRTLKSNSYDEYSGAYYAYWQRLLDGKLLRKLFSPVWEKVKNVHTEDIFKRVLSGANTEIINPEDYVNHSLYFEAKTFLHGLLVVDDRLSMANGLEVRVPFLDNDLVDFAMELPVRMKLKNIDNILRIDEDDLAKRYRYFNKTRDGKILLRKILSKYIGEGSAKQYKQGFSGPDSSWFKGESIRYVRETLLNKGAELYNYLDYSTVETLINEHISGKVNRRLLIWSFLSVEIWLKVFKNKEYNKT